MGNKRYENPKIYSRMEHTGRRQTKNIKQRQTVQNRRAPRIPPKTTGYEPMYPRRVSSSFYERLRVYFVISWIAILFLREDIALTWKDSCLLSRCKSKFTTVSKIDLCFPVGI